MDFYDLDLNDPVLDALDDMNFTECTPIQEHAIPVILEGRDLIGVAQTGTGKTAAYLLPILSKLSDGGYPSNAINCIIMSPTRELAQQIDQAMEGFSYHVSVSSVAVYGGNDGIRYEQEKRGLAMGADVIIATPGRLISHLSLGNVDLSHVSFFILDEADRMLDMGFSDDIMQIVKHLPEERQTIMFSATMPDKIQELAKTILRNPVEVKLAVSKPAEKIIQSAYICYEAQKIRLVKELFKERNPERVIIFASSKLKVKDIDIALRRAGFNTGAMHSDLEQAERDEVMYKFKTQQIDILVATDIVARGIDIDDIQLVLNFDVPHDAEDYVHRIGRTARANHDGEAITFVGEKDQLRFASIERFLEKDIEKRPIPEELGEAPAYRKGSERKSSSGKKRSSSCKRNSENKDNRSEGNNRRRRRNGKPTAENRQAADTTSRTSPATTETVATSTPEQTGTDKPKKRFGRHRNRHRNKNKGNDTPTPASQE